MFRIIAENGMRWTVVDESTKDPAVFLSQHFYESTSTKMKFIVVDDAIINLDKIVAIERVQND